MDSPSEDRVTDDDQPDYRPLTPSEKEIAKEQIERIREDLKLERRPAVGPREAAKALRVAASPLCPPIEEEETE